MSGDYPANPGTTVDPGTVVGDVDEIGEVVRFDVVGHGAGVRVMHVVGEIDTLTAPILQGRLADQLGDVEMLVVDMTDVTFLGSAGLAVLVAAKEQAAGAQRRLRLVPGSRIVTRALEATGLLGLFDTAADVPEALNSST